MKINTIKKLTQHNPNLIAYLAAMDNLTISEFVITRRHGLKAIDDLRLFYVAKYMATIEQQQSKQ